MKTPETLHVAVTKTDYDSIRAGTLDVIRRNATALNLQSYLCTVQTSPGRKTKKPLKRAEAEKLSHNTWALHTQVLTKQLKPKCTSLSIHRGYVKDRLKAEILNLTVDTIQTKDGDTQPVINIHFKLTVQ